jgi:hypothetical protein
VTEQYRSAFWALVYAGIAGCVHFLIINAPVDLDSAYHAAVGALIRRHGILHAFPWTPFSWLAAHYADKELLFHLLFVPLAALDWIQAVKIVGTLTSAALIFSIYTILRKEGVRLAGLWALFPLVLSPVFLWRFSLVRPHIVSIALALLVLGAAAGNRRFMVALIAAVYPWAYVAWQLPFLLAVVSQTAAVLAGRKWGWGVVGASVLGTAIGLLLHPNAWNLLTFTWIQIGEVLVRTAWQAREGFELGEEFRPFSVVEWIGLFTPSVLLALSAVVLAWRHRRSESQSLAFALATLVFFGLTVKSGKFTDYFVPFTVVAFALAARSVSRRFVPAAVFGATLVITAVPLYEQTRVLGQFENFMPSEDASRLQHLVPPGSQVFTEDWLSTGLLIRSLPDRRFIGALDPTFVYMKDPELYRLWYGIPRTAPANAASVIRRRFGARFVLSFLYGSRFGPFYNALGSDPTVSWVPVGKYWLLFDLGEPGAER